MYLCYQIINTHEKNSRFNLQEMLIVLAIIGILLLIALPSLMPLIGKAKSVEAQITQSALPQSRDPSFSLFALQWGPTSLDFAPVLVTEGGSANYRYTILEASAQHFLAQAELW